MIKSSNQTLPAPWTAGAWSLLLAWARIRPPRGRRCRRPAPSCGDVSARTGTPTTHTSSQSGCHFRTTVGKAWTTTTTTMGATCRSTGTQNSHVMRTWWVWVVHGKRQCEFGCFSPSSSCCCQARFTVVQWGCWRRGAASVWRVRPQLQSHRPGTSPCGCFEVLFLMNVSMFVL